MNNIKGIIFDYGGTLDTNGVHWFHIFRQVYAKYRSQITEEQLREAYVYAERYLATHRVIKSTDDFLSMLKKKVAIQSSHLQCFQSEETIALACDKHVRKNMEETRKVLDTIAARYPMTLVSNFYGNIHSVLHAYDLDSYFKAVVESAVVGMRKPDPQIFALGIKSLDLQPHEVLVVGDSYSKDIIPAHSLGCHTVWLKGQGWNATNEPTDSSCAGHIIHNLKEITTLL